MQSEWLRWLFIDNQTTALEFRGQYLIKCLKYWIMDHQYMVLHEQVFSANEAGCMILVIDNYDSFTYNLVQYFRQLAEPVCVQRNDQVTVLDVEQMKPLMIVLSPGPGKPENAGVCTEIVQKCAGRIPILGICLGQQVINDAFGGKTVKALQPMHGKVKPVYHEGAGVFQGLKSPLNVTRYHSLIADRANLPDCLAITAWSHEDEIMGIIHREHLVEGVQFHPEAILTEHGMDMLANFLHRANAYRSDGILSGAASW